MSYVEEEIARINTKVSRLDLIEMYEQKIRVHEIELESFNRILEYLQKPDISKNLKWREEIRHCLKNRKELLSSAEISNCVCIRHDTEPNRNIKLKVGTTLSMMFNEGEIGRYIPDGLKDYRYGLGEFFNKDNEGKLTELKK